MLGFARSQMNARESRQSKVWRDAGVWRSEINLGNFIAGPSPRILDIRFDGQRVSRFQRIRGQMQFGVCKGRIAQPIAKSVQRRALEVTISPIGHRIVRERGKPIDRLVELNRSTAAW